MVQKRFLRLLVLFLVFSYVLSSAVAVPTTRSLKSTEENPSSVEDLLVQGTMDLNTDDGLFDAGERFVVEGRMDMESTDYPGTGANNHHDPKTPGRA